MKKKVAIITPKLSGNGGTETVLKTVLQENKYFKNLNRIDLVILGGHKHNQWITELPSKVKVHFSTDNQILRILVLSYWLLFGGFEQVICLSTTIIRWSALIRKIFRKKYLIVSWIHFSIFNEKTVDPDKLHYADYHLAISSGIVKQLKSLGITANRICLIFNPVDKKKRVILPANDGVIHLAYVGRVMLNGQKDLQELFDALALLPSQTVILHIYGTGQIAECKDYLTEHHVKQTVIWHGWVQDPWQEIQTLDATVLTSQYEGFPMALAESISYGVPGIASDCPTGPADIIDSQNGFLYQVGDVKGLVIDILKLIKQVHFNHATVQRTLEKYATDKFCQRFWTSLAEMK
ncbi:MAG TPA: glycosyltransferase [Candidatus Companilactobacillus pullicola]|uniref:Glycosyltransferase n=1 Tax=Candidatus Companilactobacillus pullicola TaxID=2838523 RepID=A0A9D1ZQE5_9LACO|nr:glycosyltransferase [Candidatus Companilactobacillus pullicola]